MQSLWHGVLSQFVVVRKGDHTPNGLVTAYGADFRNGRCHVAVIVSPDAEPGSAMEALSLHIDYLFAVFPFQKLVAEVNDFNWAQFSAGEGRMFEREGILRQHEFHDGRYWDVHLLAIFRDRWASYFAESAAVRAGLIEMAGEEMPNSFDGFANRLAKEFNWSGPLTEATRLRQDLNCDSVTYLELLLVLEEQTAEDIGDEVFVNIETLGQLFHLFYAFLPE